MKHIIEQYFPKGERVFRTNQKDENFAYLPLEESSWWKVSLAELTDREKELLSLFQKEEEEFVHPWKEYLVNGQLPAPVLLEQVQFVYVHWWKTANTKVRTAWLDMMQELLPHQVTHFRQSKQDDVFVLKSDESRQTVTILQETLSAMEFDFGVRLSIFVGKTWSEESYPLIFQAESELFRKWQESYDQPVVLSFSTLFLWGQIRASEEVGILGNQIKTQLLSQEQLPEIVLALWEEGAVLTKAAQKLYIHRNTLQYRLEKWQELSGFQLKDLTDLTVCYLLLLEEFF